MKQVTTANINTVVQVYKPAVYDKRGPGISLAQVHLEEHFSGDVVGEGVATVLQAINKDNSIHFVAQERVTGTLANKDGTFLLQVSGTVVNKVMHAEWFVIPGSGTAALAGLRGTGGFQAMLGEKGEGTLNYWFE